MFPCLRFFPDKNSNTFLAAQGVPSGNGDTWFQLPDLSQNMFSTFDGMLRHC